MLLEGGAFSLRVGAVFTFYYAPQPELMTPAVFTITLTRGGTIFGGTFLSDAGVFYYPKFGSGRAWRGSRAHANNSLSIYIGLLSYRRRTVSGDCEKLLARFALKLPWARP
jgi:hypothetical protein